VHYFIDALETTSTHPTRVQDQARYFGKAAPADVTLTGKEALEYVSTLLRTRPFHVLTRWELVPNMDRYYALIFVEYEKGKWTYLSDLLVRQGFARVDGVTTALPDDPRDETAYLVDLKQHASYARQKRVGIWAKVKG
jgi:endonuclease YncB( thermonuclease family)